MLKELWVQTDKAQFICNNLSDAYATLFDWYNFTYVHPKETSVRKLKTNDEKTRSILEMPYRDLDGAFDRIGDIFDHEINPGRKNHLVFVKL